MRKIFYFCNVKSLLRYIAAASKQRFLCPYLLVKYSRIEWGNSNVPKVFAVVNLTARNAAFLLSN
jgi:hypothetical protein